MGRRRPSPIWSSRVCFGPNHLWHSILRPRLADGIAVGRHVAVRDFEVTDNDSFSGATTKHCLGLKTLDAPCGNRAPPSIDYLHMSDQAAISTADWRPDRM